MRGSCLCGQVEYTVSQLDSPIGHCSCRSCRKAHAAAFNTYASVRHEHFQWLRGEQVLKSFESSSGKQRVFCGNCGTHLIARCTGDDEFVVLRVATLDEDPGQTPQEHIWASHEVPWLAYGPDIQAYAERAPRHR